jgi:DNA-binding ferritin-like protein (Dps family)
MTDINISNPDDIKHMINIIKKYIEENNNKDNLSLEMDILNLYPDYYDRYPFLIKYLCKRTNDNMLDVLLNNLKIVNDDKTQLNKVEKDLGNELAQKYIYPKLNK